jgi:hypothetical protein
LCFETDRRRNPPAVFFIFMRYFEMPLLRRLLRQRLQQLLRHQCNKTNNNVMPAAFVMNLSACGRDIATTYRSLRGRPVGARQSAGAERCPLRDGDGRIRRLLLPTRRHQDATD